MDAKELGRIDLQTYWARRAEELAANAMADGVVVTIGLRAKLPLAMGHYEHVVEVREKRPPAEPRICLLMPVIRDEEGYWSNPGIPDFGEDDAASYQEWYEKQGLEIARKSLDDEDVDHPAYVAYFDDASSGCRGWNPAPPDGKGWHTISIHDTEDGPYWFWARRREIDFSDIGEL